MDFLSYVDFIRSSIDPDELSVLEKILLTLNIAEVLIIMRLAMIYTNDLRNIVKMNTVILEFISNLHAHTRMKEKKEHPKQNTAH